MRETQRRDEAVTGTRQMPAMKLAIAEDRAGKPMARTTRDASITRGQPDERLAYGRVFCQNLAL